MHYSTDGRIEDREQVTDQARLDQLNAARRAAQRDAVPLNTYLAVARSA